MSKPLRAKVFVLEDCPLIREMVRIRCTTLGGMEVVGESATVEETIKLLPGCAPNIIVLDIGLPDSEEDGFAVAEYAREHLPETKILVVSGYLNEYTLSKCESLRVNGFVGKPSASSPVLDDALRSVAEGKCYFSTSYLAARQTWVADPCAVSKRLSAREIEVMLLVARGLNDEEIARELNVTENTAATHRGKVMRKLGLPSSLKLMAHANERGFGETR